MKSIKRQRTLTVEQKRSNQTKFEDFVTKTKKKVVDLEDRSHGNNQRFDGFQEETNETWEESESIITFFVKEKVEIEEDILTERAHRTGKIRRNDGTKNRKITIVVKFLNFKEKSRSLLTYREKKLWKAKNLWKREFFGGDSKYS